MKMKLILGAVVVLGILFSVLKPQPTLCERYEKATNQLCEKEIMGDGNYDVVFLKGDDQIIFTAINGKKQFVNSTSLLESSIYDEPIHWIATTKNEQDFIVGLASADVDEIEMVAPVNYKPNRIQAGGYSIFYIPIESEEHKYAVNIQAFNEQGEMIYGK